MKSILFYCIFLLTCLTLHAQYRKDVQLITGIQINKDLPKGFDISAQYQLRLNNYLANVRGSYFYGSVRYSLIKKVLAAEFEYRYSTSAVRDQHRFGLGIMAKHKIKQFTFSDRLVYQREHEYFNSSYENGHEPGNVLRNRVQVKWDFKKNWDAYVSLEPFFSISNEEKEISKVRSIAGFNWEVKKNHTINIFYQYQSETNTAKPKMLHTIACIYEWDVPKFKKKK